MHSSRVSFGLSPFFFLFLVLLVLLLLAVRAAGA
jgi:hypothetical protein